MITFRVTEQKLNEYLGDDFVYALDPKKSPRFKLFPIMMLLLLLLPLFSILSGIQLGFSTPLLGVLFMSSTILVVTPSLMYHQLKSIFFMSCVPKMRKLVTDQQLLWLNSTQETVTRLGRTPKNQLSEVNFSMLAFLKKNGTSQAFYKTVQSMGSSNSAAITFKRLARKVVYDQSIIQKEGSDFKYVPWEFKIVDKNNKAVATTEIAKMEKLLNKLWEKLIDNYLNEEMG
ncbi:MAG TPA: hypothetical protein VJK72_04055 [Candidatus Nanoarchaeia archaeon]|nr:hypothetical protein [Candidatus Nanoarchaeia archaeon]